MIYEFKNEYFFLSNFYESNVTYGGITYRNNEAAFQAQKTLDMELRKQFAVLDPSNAKRLGREVVLRDDWERVKTLIMYEICVAKFTQNVQLREKLLATRDQYLSEGNWWHDNEWGVCKCLECQDIRGKNKLGQILMRVREKLSNE